MTLSRDQREEYQKTLEETRDRIKSIEEEMAEELEKTRERLRKLLEEKKAMRKIYDGLALLLGLENEFEKQESEEKAQNSDLEPDKIIDSET